MPQNQPNPYLAYTITSLIYLDLIAEKDSSGLLVEKTVPAEVLVGQAFSYTYKVSNLTDYPIQDVVLSDRVSAGFAATDAAPKADVREGVATWQIGNLGAKESRVIRVNGSAKDEGALTTCGWASYSPVLCEEIKVVKAALQLVKNAPAEVTTCDKIPMVLTVKNAAAAPSQASESQTPSRKASSPMANVSSPSTSATSPPAKAKNFASTPLRPTPANT